MQPSALVFSAASECDIHEQRYAAEDDRHRHIDVPAGVIPERAVLFTAAGVDSIEHANYMDEETISMLADSKSVWVPTLVTVRNLMDCGRFENEILSSIIRTGEENLKKAFRKKVHVAVGSDAGAFKVLHGKGTEDECRAFFDILGETPEVCAWMEEGEERIRTLFRHGSSNLIQV